MATGKSGYFDLASFSPTGFTLRINWEEDYEVTTNLSKTKITSIQAKSANWAGYAYYPDGCIKLNGTTILRFSSSSGTAVVNINGYNKFYTLVDPTTLETITAELDIEHETDGSKTTLLELVGNNYSNFRFYLGSWQDDGVNGGSGWRVTCSQELVLTDIPRASTIAATDANIGAVSMIAVSRKSTAYTHSIAYKFGSLSGYITADGGVSSSEVKFATASIGFTVPTSFYEQIPKAKNGVCTLTVRTYSGSTQIGEAQTATFTATADQESCAPSVSGTVVDSNEATKALTGDASKLVKYCSNALCTIETEAKNGASLTSKKIGGVSVSGNTRTISAVENNSIAFEATDSRGYSTKKTVQSTMINYIKLTVNAQLNRVDPTSGNAFLIVRGNYFNSSFGAKNNTLSIKYRLAKSGESYGSWTELTPTISDNAYLATASLSGLDYQYPYNVEVVCEDQLISKTVVAPVGKGIPLADWGDDDFRFNVPLLITESMYGTSLPSSGRKGQLFFLSKGDGTYEIRIHNGSSW